MKPFLHKHCVQRFLAATQDVAQVVVDPDGTLESDEVPVTGGTNDGDMDATIADLGLLQKRSRQLMKKTSEPLCGDVDGTRKGQLGTFRSQ